MEEKNCLPTMQELMDRVYNKAIEDFLRECQLKTKYDIIIMEPSVSQSDIEEIAERLRK